ncbi:DUF397 domain-containing protein [Microbispora sp. NPDC049125]|uniref:DUF397 domain-containing protein n=1 Tax=Microbispora sp. NPDC049125 TaxID=3154929 RepID=UPI0034676D0B
MKSSQQRRHADAVWIKASRCNNGNCVEVANLGQGVIGLRDTKVAGGPVLEFPRDAWNAFVQEVKDGAHDPRIT